MDDAFDMVVVGAGAAGLVTAAGCARLGVKTAIVEKHRYGGECLWNGCVPSKALLHTAKINHAFRNAGRWGLASRTDPPDFAAVMGHMRDVIRTIEPHDSPERFRKMGVETMVGEARFTGKDRLSVNGRVLRARRFTLATGADPVKPDIEGLTDVPYLTFEDFFDMERQPGHLLIVGGGPIGCEMAQAFRRLGSEVTVVQSNKRLLPKDDMEATELLKQVLLKEGVRIETEAKPVRAEKAGAEIRLLCRKADGTEFSVEGDTLLVAAGKRPRVEGLGLDLAGVAYSKTGVEVDATLATTNPRIYAAGDVTGKYLFTHMAEYQAGLVVFNALAPLVSRSADYRVVPWVTYTDPELAHVGMSEEEARQLYGDDGVGIFRYRVGDNDRHIIEGETEGLVKIVTDASGGILGATILSANAGELIHEYALAVRQNCRIHDLSGMIHAYPTLAQANKRACDQAMAARYLGGWIPKVVAGWNRLMRPR